MTVSVVCSSSVRCVYPETEAPVSVSVRPMGCRVGGWSDAFGQVLFCQIMEILIPNSDALEEFESYDWGVIRGSKVTS